ncbi:hypothetical protein [Nocardia sp. NPDC059239]|uniref:hypothetical protein n=1 Tax=Nocardia sp. NPDC059239 TaxID=3346785 RepID=UPI00367F258A
MEPDEYRISDEWLRVLARVAERDRLAAELTVYRQTLAAIRAADPDLFDDPEERGGAYETHGSAGDRLRQAYAAAIAPSTALENPHA